VWSVEKCSWALRRRRRTFLNLGFCLLSISAQLSNVKTELAPLPLLPFALESCRASSSYHLVFLNAFHAFLLSALQMLFCSSIFFHAVLVCCCTKLCLQLGFLMSHPPPPPFSVVASCVSSTTTTQDSINGIPACLIQIFMSWHTSPLLMWRR
jgi:hypothetical protein